MIYALARRSLGPAHALATWRDDDPWCGPRSGRDLPPGSRAEPPALRRRLDAISTRASGAASAAPSLARSDSGPDREPDGRGCARSPSARPADPAAAAFAA